MKSSLSRRRHGWARELGVGPRERCSPWAGCSLVCLLAVAGCRQDMHNQPKYKPLRASEFFRDGSSARPVVEGTVARGTLQEDEAFFTGKVSGAAVTEMPFAVDAHVLDRGEQRYNIYCTPCHDATGSGKGWSSSAAIGRRPRFTTSGCARRHLVISSM